ncbi:MAG: phage tail protein [Aquaticitalea sp.]
MPTFPVNTHRFDPYRNFKFRVKWDGKYIAAVSKMSALKRMTEPVKHREGSDSSAFRNAPGLTTFGTYYT